MAEFKTFADKLRADDALRGEFFDDPGGVLAREGIELDDNDAFALKASVDAMRGAGAAAARPISIPIPINIPEL